MDITKALRQRIDEAHDHFDLEFHMSDVGQIYLPSTAALFGGTWQRQNIIAAYWPSCLSRRDALVADRLTTTKWSALSDWPSSRSTSSTVHRWFPTADRYIGTRRVWSRASCYYGCAANGLFIAQLADGIAITSRLWRRRLSYWWWCCRAARNFAFN